MRDLNIEEQIYLCKYHDVDKHLNITMKISQAEVKEIISKLKERGLYEKYRNLEEQEYENIIKEDKHKSKYEKILDKYNFDKTKKSYNSIRRVLAICDNLKAKKELRLEKVFKIIADEQNVKSYIINNDCKRILDNTYLLNKKIFEDNKYYKKPTLKEFVIQELNLQDFDTEEIEYDKEDSNEIKEDNEKTNIKDLKDTYVKVSVRTMMEAAYYKRIFRQNFGSGRKERE